MLRFAGFGSRLPGLLATLAADLSGHDCLSPARRGRLTDAQALVDPAAGPAVGNEADQQQDRAVRSRRVGDRVGPRCGIWWRSSSKSTYSPGRYSRRLPRGRSSSSTIDSVTRSRRATVKASRSWWGLGSPPTFSLRPAPDGQCVGSRSLRDRLTPGAPSAPRCRRTCPPPHARLRYRPPASGRRREPRPQACRLSGLESSYRLGIRAADSILFTLLVCQTCPDEPDHRTRRVGWR